MSNQIPRLHVVGPLKLTAMAILVPMAVMVFALAGGGARPGAPIEHRYDVRVVAAISQMSTTVGISDSDLYWNAGDPSAVAASLDRMKTLGVTSVRIVIPWALTETSQGVYDWTAVDNMVNAANARGMSVLGVVGTTPQWARPGTGLFDFYVPPNNPQDLGNFASAMAARYAGKISAYEVWNEPNASLSYQPGPNPAGYTALLKAAYTAIKAADKNATVIGGVLGSTITIGNATLNPVDFVAGMYAAGAEGYFDALSFHPYQFSTPFSQGAGLANSPLNQLAAIYGLMQANGDAAKMIWATEYGLPTGTVGDAAQASYVKDFLSYWSTLSYAGPSYIYTLNDRNSSDTTDPENTFGLFRDDGTAKPVVQVIKDWIAAHTPVTTPPPIDPGVALAAALNQLLQQYLQALSDALAAAFAPKTATVNALAVPATTSAAVSTTTSAPATTSAAVPTTTSAPTTTASASATATATTSSSVPTATSTTSAAVPTTTSTPTTTSAAVPTTTSTPTTTSAAVPTTTSTPTTTASASATATTSSSVPTVPQSTSTTTAAVPSAVKAGPTPMVAAVG